MRPINQRRLNEGFAPLHFLLPPVKAYGFFVKRASADLTEPHVPRRERCEESYPPSESCSLVTYINTDDVELSVNSALLGFWPRESQIELSTLRLNSSRLPISIQNTERDSLIAKSTCRYTKQASLQSRLCGSSSSSAFQVSGFTERFSERRRWRLQHNKVEVGEVEVGRWRGSGTDGDTRGC